MARRKKQHPASIGGRTSPWAHIADRLEASARKHNALRNELGLAFRGAQQKAYESWCAWEADAESKD